MTAIRLEVHPRAVAEARAARRWYARRSIAAANRFISELDHAIQQITDTPDLWQPYLHGTRAYRLGRFPYLVVYQEVAGTLYLLAVAHGRRRPGYWKRRVS
jgi:plasmid stabilization system protein ParE